MYRKQGLFLKKLKIELQFNLTIPLWSIYPKKMKTVFQKSTCTPKFIEALFTITRIWKQPKYPSADGWIKQKM